MDGESYFLFAGANVLARLVWWTLLGACYVTTLLRCWWSLVELVFFLSFLLQTACWWPTSSGQLDNNMSWWWVWPWCSALLSAELCEFSWFSCWCDSDYLLSFSGWRIPLPVEGIYLGEALSSNARSPPVAGCAGCSPSICYSSSCLLLHLSAGVALSWLSSSVYLGGGCLWELASLRKQRYEAINWKKRTWFL